MNDPVERDDVIKAVAEYLRHKAVKETYPYASEKIERYIPFAEQIIMPIPSARPKGKWIDISEWYSPKQKCSICEEIVEGYGSNFCPNCGADMRGE